MIYIIGLWIADIVTSLQVISVLGSLISGVAIIISGIGVGIANDTPRNPTQVEFWTRICKRSFKFFVPLVMLGCLLPTKNTIYVGLGLYAAKDIVQTVNASPAAAELSGKTLKLLNLQLDKMITSSSPNK